MIREINNLSLNWRFKENLQYVEAGGIEVRTNNLGFGGEDFYPEKEKESVKILCLGDSCKFGVGIEYKDTYPCILEKKLKGFELQKKVRVVNCGVPAYTSFQGFRFLERYLALFNPEFVTIYFGNHE